MHISYRLAHLKLIIFYSAFVLCIGSVILMSVGFFWLLNIQNSLEKDQFPPCEEENGAEVEFKKYMCDKFMGKHNDDILHYSWRPGKSLLISYLFNSEHYEFSCKSSYFFFFSFFSFFFFCFFFFF